MIIKLMLYNIYILQKVQGQIEQKYKLINNHSSQSYYNEYNNSSLEQCALHCLTSQNIGCISYEFNSTVKVCRLSGQWSIYDSNADPAVQIYEGKQLILLSKCLWIYFTLLF